jgi:hypothetical protein
MDSGFDAFDELIREWKSEQGRVGYLVLWMMGAPIGLLLLLWVVLGNNLIGPG